jgi:tetratricopeptide (TPR) repeat protein
LLTKAHNNPSGLSAEELLWVSNNLASDNNAKLQLLNASLNVYPDDFALLNNVGAMALVQGDLTKAKTMLDKALNKKDDSKTKNNLAGVSMANGDRATAKKMLSQIKDKTPEVSYNNAIIMILEGKYASAISSCGSEGSFNKALAQVLNGNLSEASKTLAGSNDKESADGYYLKAIIAARSNAGIDAVVSNLKSAISKDKKYKEKAGKDREFIKFMNDATFTSAIN